MFPLIHCDHSPMKKFLPVQLFSAHLCLYMYVCVCMCACKHYVCVEGHMHICTCADTMSMPKDTRHNINKHLQIVNTSKGFHR